MKGRSSHQSCSVIKGVLRNFAKETLTQVLFCELCGISKNNLFTEHSGRLLLERQKIYKPNICSCKKIKIQNFSKKNPAFFEYFFHTKKNQDQYKEVRNERPNIVMKNSIQVAVYGIANSSYYKIPRKCLLTKTLYVFSLYTLCLVCLTEGLLFVH